MTWKLFKLCWQWGYLGIVQQFYYTSVFLLKISELKKQNEIVTEKKRNFSIVTYATIYSKRKWSLLLCVRH